MIRMEKLSKEIRENIVYSMEELRKHHEDDMFEYQVDFSKQDDENLVFYRDEWIVNLDEVLSDEQYAEDMQDLYYEDGTDIYEYFGVGRDQ